MTWLSIFAVCGPVEGIAFAAEAKPRSARLRRGIESRAEDVMRAISE
jgi:hypothetical protein